MVDQEDGVDEICKETFQIIQRWKQTKTFGCYRFNWKSVCDFYGKNLTKNIPAFM